MDDDTLWSLDELLTLAQHDDPNVRTWALEHLVRQPSPRAVEAAVAGIGHREDKVTRAAIVLARALKDVAPLEAFREPLRTTAQHNEDPVLRAAAALALIQAGDDEGAAHLTTVLRKSGRSLEATWRAFAREAPASCFAALRGLDVFGAAGASRGRATAFVEAAPVEALHEAVTATTRMPDDVASDVMVSLLTRAAAEHLLPADDNVERAFSATLERWQSCWSPASPKARTWLALAAFRDMFQAARHNQVRKVLVGCRAWDARVPAYHPEGEAAKALLAALDGLRSPTLLHARAGLALAIAASERALAHEAPFERCAPEVQVMLACAGPLRLAPGRISTIVARYGDEAAREPVARALDAVFEGNNDVAHEHAFVLASRLRGYVPPEAALRHRDGDSDATIDARVHALTMMPEALRALAPSIVPKPRYGAVLEALGKQNQRWASSLLLQHFDALIATEDDEALIGALGALGDARAIDALVAAWRPGEAAIARDVVDIARLHDRVDALPEALRAEGTRNNSDTTLLRRAMSMDGLREALTEEADKPLVLGLRCKRCGRTWHQEVGQVTIHPNRELCAREGWDGICFERIAVCKYCGAEDDYELPAFASVALVSQTLASVLRGAKGDGPVAVRVPVLADGTHIRRPSDALRYWQAKIDKNPRDSEAWLRLAINLKKQQRSDQAVEAFLRAITLRPGRIDAPGMFLDLLTELGRTKELAPYAEQVLVALPKDHHESANFRQDAAATALKALRDAGEPRGLSMSWIPLGPGDEGAGVVDLARITAHDTLAAMLAHKRVTNISLKAPTADDHDSPLERRIEAGNGFDRKEGGYTIQTPVVRAEPRVGRNDPCPCGSGQKYKKCHGR